MMGTLLESDLERYLSRFSTSIRDQSCFTVNCLILQSLGHSETHLVHVDGWLPLLVSQQVESAHTDLSEVTGMVFVQVRPQVVLFNP